MTKEKMITIAKEVKELLLPIPANEFITGTFSNGKDKCCALGHIIRLQTENPSNYIFDDSPGWVHDINMVVSKFLFDRDVHKGDVVPISYSLATINDNRNSKYPQFTPKERVMAFLDDVINH